MGACDPKGRFESNYSEYCPFVLASNSCQFDSGFFNYYRFEFCTFQDRVWPTIFLVLWLLILLVAVATTADSFFAPCLVVVTRILRMSQNLAGVTLLALGNGAADVFSSLSAVISVNTPNVDLSFGAILGAGIFVNMVTAGVIMIIIPFSVMRRPIMKDLLFYFISLIWCMVIIIKRRIELWSSAVFLLIYVIYVLVTGISRVVYVKWNFADKKILPSEKEQQGRINDSEKSTKNENAKGVVNAAFIPNADLLESLYSLPGNSRGPRSSNHLNVCDELNRQNYLTLIEMRNLTINRKKSMNHRSIGTFAKYIIENEYQKKIKKFHELEQIIEVRRRTVSLNHGSETINPEIVHKFNSLYERPTYSQDVCICESPSISGIETRDKRFQDLSPKEPSETLHEQSQIESSREDTLTASVPTEREEVTFPGLWRHFLLTVFPVSINEWKGQSLLEKIISIAQSPIMFLLTLTIPVADEGAYLGGWCKILNCLHCITSPIICITMIRVSLIYIGNTHFAIIYIFLIVGIIAAVAVALTSKADTPPVYYPLFAFLGFIASIFWIYEIANEIVNILETFGIVLGIRQTVLGISVLAFANSIGDMVSNIMLARKNFPRIAYAACIGGPLFNLLVGIGLPFTIVTVTKPHVDIQLKSETVVLIFTILLVTALNIVALPLMRFQMKRIYGIILIVLYVIFFILVILFASKVIRVVV